MPTEFQKVIDKVLANFINAFVYIRDILIVSSGSLEGHSVEVRKILKALDEANLRIKFDKCAFFQSEVEWVGYKISSKGIKPINEKVQAITEKMKPKNLTELRSYLGAVNQLSRFIPNLAMKTEPFRDLLKHSDKWTWNEKHDRAFRVVQNALSEIAAVSHFDKALKIRIMCDVCREGIGSVLQQKTKEGWWKPIAYASRFLRPHEENIPQTSWSLVSGILSKLRIRNKIFSGN